MKRCPYCDEEIQDEAIRCRFCGSDLRLPLQALSGGRVQEREVWPSGYDTMVQGCLAVGADVARYDDRPQSVG